MPKLVLMKGLPASGKSTQARKMIDESGNMGRVNRDDLRKMLFNGKWTGRRERIVVNIEKAIASILLDAGQGVIVDDTNLTKSAQLLWKNYAADNGKVRSVVIKDMREHNKNHSDRYYFESCIERDNNRQWPSIVEGKVGRTVIEGMALRTGNMPRPEYDKYAIFDMDGTLSDVGHRVHFLRGKKPDWPQFFEGCWFDPPNHAVVSWAKAIADTPFMSTQKDQVTQHGIGLIVVSARPADKCEEATIKWLERHKIKFDHIFMRQAKDSRNDVIVKKEILHGIVNWLGSKDRIAFCVDDRPSVIKMWREEGLTVYPVHTDRWVGVED